MKTTLALMIMFIPFIAYAADDDFGGRYFTAQTPAALSDATQTIADSSADAVANIEPAAGDSVLPLDDPAQKGRIMLEQSAADNDAAPDDVE